jgi:hypothetical protein
MLTTDGPSEASAPLRADGSSSTRSTSTACSPGNIAANPAPSRLGAGLAAMFPGLAAIDVDDIDRLPGALSVALDRDGPAVVAVSCSPDEIPPFAAFLTSKGTSHVAAHA